MAKLLVPAGVVLAAALSFCTGSKPAVKAPAFQRGMNVTRYYEDTCAKCHGSEAQGNGSSTKSLIDWEKYDQKNDRPFFEAIKNGVPNMGMEAYGDVLKDNEVWAMVVHLRELQYRGLRAKFGGPKAENGIFKGKRADYKIETVVDTDQGLRVPWAIDWLPDGRMLVTNLPGFMSVIKDGKTVCQVEGLPESRQLGQGGMMEVAVHPDYAKNGWIYLGYTEPGKERGGLTKIVRGKLQLTDTTAKWTDQQTVFEAPQEFYTDAGIHFGTRIVFDGQGHVFFVVGERGGNMLAQRLDTPYGKIYRLNEDGSEPADNPYVGKTGAIKGVWSWGHRNPQGLVFDLQGKLWDTEHAPRGGDEVNLIEKGANYGWPVICFGINYNDTPFQVPWPTPEQHFNMPAFRWLPSTGACGLDVVRGNAFPQWKGDLVAGGLSGQNVDRLRLKDGKLVEREELIWNMGRVREVTTGPDGFVYVALNQPDKILRLVPVRKG